MGAWARPARGSPPVRRGGFALHGAIMAITDALQFLGQSFKHKATVGAVWPSSKNLARAMVKPVFTDRYGPIRVLEVGAGVGPVTEELVARLAPGDHLDVVELNHDFCETLRRRFDGHDFAPTVYEASILEFEARFPYHHIVSGLPLANFPAEMVERIYHKFFDLLLPGGTFVMFEHIGLRNALAALTVGDTRRRVRRIVEFEKRLHTLEVANEAVPFNVPPARVRVRRRPHLLAAAG